MSNECFHKPWKVGFSVPSLRSQVIFLKGISHVFTDSFQLVCPIPSTVWSESKGKFTVFKIETSTSNWIDVPRQLVVSANLPILQTKISFHHLVCEGLKWRHMINYHSHACRTWTSFGAEGELWTACDATF